MPVQTNLFLTLFLDDPVIDYDHHFVKKKGKKTKGTMKIIWKSSPVCRGLQNSKLLKGLTADSDKLSSLLYSSGFTLSHSIK